MGDDRAVRFLWLPLLTILFAAALSGQAVAQSTQPEIAKRLLHRPLYLRGFWVADKLSFDAAGKLQGNSPRISFTEAGIDVLSVKIKDDRLQIEGQRMAVAFQGDKILRVSAETKSYSGKIQIKITATDHNFDAALDAIFADGLADLAPSLPDYWQDYSMKHFANADSPVAAPKLAPSGGVAGAVQEHQGDPIKFVEHPLHVGGGVQPPRVLYDPEPEFTNLARAKKFSGNVEVYLWCEKDGSPSHLKIVRPAGLGLDEQALAAVSKYKFKPAMKDGLPVRVDLFIDVNFQIF